MLSDQLRSDLTASMKARDRVRTATLRLAIGAVREAEVAGSEARTLSDDEVLAVLRAEMKKRNEAAAAFEAAGRVDRAAAECAEAEVLSKYLPANLSAQELEALVDEVLRVGGYSSKADMGAAMRAVGAAVAGRADGRQVASIVSSRIS